MLRFIVATVVSLLTAAPAAAQSDPIYGLSIAYADGCTATQPLRPHGAFWTAMFPRTAGADTRHNGLALDVLDVDFVADGAEVTISITLVYGGFRDRVQVATVHAAPGHEARVDQLSAYGVQPVTFAVVPIEPAIAMPAVAEEPSGQLRISIEPVRAGTPLYRVTIGNQSGKDLRAIDYEIFGGDARIASGRRKTERNEPLVAAGGEYAFDYFPSRPAGGPWPTVTLLRVTTVAWDDGTFDGDPRPRAMEIGLSRQRAGRLRPIVNLLDAGTPDFARLRAAFAALDRSDIALEHARTEALAALDAIQAANDAAAFDAWVRKNRTEYRNWLARAMRAAE